VVYYAGAEKFSRNWVDMQDKDNIESLFAFWRDSPGLSIAISPWENAMRACFRFEVEVRLTAGRKHPADSVSMNIGDHGDKPGLLTLLFGDGELAFDEQEQNLLRKCNTLRNKLIHCEPDAVQRLVRELISDFTPTNLVEQVKISEDTSPAEFEEILQTREGAQPVLNTFSKEQGFYGWMIQAAGDGTFNHAAKILAKASAHIHSRM
jgi:hypothetical protein